jgi:hypothetical protein
VKTKPRRPSQKNKEFKGDHASKAWAFAGRGRRVVVEQDDGTWCTAIDQFVAVAKAKKWREAETDSPIAALLLTGSKGEKFAFSFALFDIDHSAGAISTARANKLQKHRENDKKGSFEGQ